MTETISIVPVGPGDVAAVADSLSELGMPAAFAKILADQLHIQGQKYAQEIQELVGKLEDIAREAIVERNSYRELAESWSSISDEQMAAIDARDAQIAKLRGFLKEALDWLAGFHHEAALKIRLAAEES